MHSRILTAACRKLVHVLHRSLESFLHAGVTVPVVQAGVFAFVFLDFIQAYNAGIPGFLVDIGVCWHFAVTFSGVILLVIKGMLLKKLNGKGKDGVFVLERY